MHLKLVNIRLMEDNTFITLYYSKYFFSQKLGNCACQFLFFKHIFLLGI